MEHNTTTAMATSAGGGNSMKQRPVHSQVIKIKQEIEIEKLKHPSLQQPKMKRVILRDIGRQRSRSPLGLVARERAIPVGSYVPFEFLVHALGGNSGHG
ncbi:hypothetical protein L6164_026665 [Bauhinia variegata]|uniref:Uncharacterized protein n=1 Tax=Bauhinia variegata TaxID=167791 RepID=A0ACB9LR96_BAUVA|nr:hypothetical protein L6164_026665 [Bauhinia variegata]